MFRFVAFVFVFFVSFIFYSQNRWIPNAGLKIGLLFTFGTHQNSLGVKLDSYIGNQFIQLNAGLTTRYFLSNLGKRTNFSEFRFGAGGVLMFGKPNNPINMDWGGSLHQTTSPYSIGYAYLWYYDKKGTSQFSGEWNLGIQRIDIRFENDVFGGQAKDRFRTGSLYISYRDSLLKAGLGITIWTGETKDAVWYKEPRPGAPNGYRDLTHNAYGKASHGIFYGEMKYLFYPNQTAGLRIGWDSEQVRHVFQNKISHDLVFFPKKMKRNTPHYPRLSEMGENVFEKKNTRKPSLYFSTFVNDGLMY